MDELHPVETKWTPPTDFPDLSGAKRIAIDLETNDPHLIEKGPGTHRGDSHIAGVAIGTEDGYRAYYPIGHKLGGNIDKGVVLRWVAEQLSRSHQPKIGAHLMYDLEHLAYEGVEVKGKLYDIQYAEPLLDENRRSYSLNNIARDRLGESKVTPELYDWIHTAYGKGAGGECIWKSPVGLVGPYAEGDVDLPLRIFDIQAPLLREQGLWDLFEMECSLMPMMLKMRQRGVRVDLEKAGRIKYQLEQKIVSMQKELNKLAGFQCNVKSPDDLSKLFDKLCVPYPRTDKGNPSFQADWFENLDLPHREIQCILTIRKFRTILSTFLDGYIFGNHVNGRIYTLFHPLKGDGGGTVSGRYSSSIPNLQNVPIRDKTVIDVDGKPMQLGLAIRSLFIPDEGELWYKDDYSQVEFRLLTHYGTGDSAEAARDAYNKDPLTDFHTLVAEMCQIDRSPAKNINFGLAYNMGEVKLAAQLGVPIENARALFKRYHERLPFVSKLQESVTNMASNRGYIKTFLGRRARFELFEPSDWDLAKVSQPCSREQANKKWSRIRRAYTYKAMNRLIQGTAADVMKKSMADIWKSGVCDVLGAPLLTVHDELDWSFPDTPATREAHKEALNIMETSLKFKIPLNCDSECGPNWGEVA